MPSLFLSFLSGFTISFSGSLPPSNMSAVAMELTMEKSKKAGLWFGAGSAIVEMLYVRLYFMGFDAFIKKSVVFLVLQWIMIVLFFTLGLILFIKTYRRNQEKPKRKKNYAIYTATKSMFLGAALKAINPFQFVYWAFWSTYLIANNWLKPTQLHYNGFCLGIGIATFTGSALYVFLGEYLESRSFFNKLIFHRGIAIFLSITSVAWAIKLLIKPEGLLL